VPIGQPTPRGHTTRNSTAGTLTIDARPAGESEAMPDPWTGRPSEVRLDQYGPNVAVEYVLRVLPRSTFVGREPSMFRAGSLPALTASGADPSVLWSVPWDLRHSAATTGSRFTLLKIIEEGPDEIDRSRLQNRGGQGLLNHYLAAVRSWAVTAPPPDELTEADVAALFGDRPTP